MAAAKPKSVLVGFSTCPLCGGKTHVKRIEAEGKRPYSHCLDEFDHGCSHTHYATNPGQERLMLAKTRPVATPTPTRPPEPAKGDDKPPSPPTPTATPAAAPPPPPTPARRLGLFG
jgi:hypothetical protein